MIKYMDDYINEFNPDCFGKKYQYHLSTDHRYDSIDVIQRIYLYGLLNDDIYKKDGIFAIIKNLRFIVDDKVLVHFSSTYIKIWTELTCPNSLKIYTFDKDKPYSIISSPDSLHNNTVFVVIPIKFQNGIPIFLFREKNKKFVLEIEFEKHENLIIHKKYNNKKEIDLKLGFTCNQLSDKEKEIYRNDEKNYYYEELLYIKKPLQANNDNFMEYIKGIYSPKSTIYNIPFDIHNNISEYTRDKLSKDIDIQFIVNDDDIIKEIFWVFDNNNHNSSLFFNFCYDIAQSFSINTNRLREATYYNYVQPWQHHNRIPVDGLYVYSLALHPQQILMNNNEHILDNENFKKIELHSQVISRSNINLYVICSVLKKLKF